MITNWNSASRMVSLLVLSGAFWVIPARGALISYDDASYPQAASLGSTNFSQTAGLFFIEIKFVADTSTIVPFSVTGASGFENFVGQGTVDLYQYNSQFQLVQHSSANFLPGQIYVSVDQANSGVGFGSQAGGPTYPLGTYSGTPSIPYSSYDLSTAFTVAGYSWFCPSGCSLGQPGPALQTDQGLLIITPTGPTQSDFTATVVLTPEPTSMLLAASGLAMLLLRLHRTP